jgi:thiamine biosynthesis protein ThiI
MKSVLILHYHEIWLKGGNKKYFLSRLITAIKQSLEDLSVAGPQYVSERLILRPRDEAAVPQIIERLRRVFGLAYIALGREVPRDMEGLGDAACELMTAKDPRTFAVRAKIADTTFGMNSMELEKALGQRILDHLRSRGSSVQVKLNDPRVTCCVEIIPGSALMYADRIEGAGGLPAVTSGKVLVLLSGGFDSGVAAYKMMRRGAHASFVHFFGPPSSARGSSRPIAEQIVRTLTPYQFTSRLYLVPFDSIQRQIVAGAHEGLRLLLYRRLMARIAREIAKTERALGLVTGDSVSQVASQTLHNMAALDRGLDLSMYRPLAGDDKQDILKMARDIGTYQISCQPFEDCCPRFMPRSPVIFSRPEQLVEAESHLNIEGLVTEGLEGTTAVDFTFAKGLVECREAAIPRLRKLLVWRAAAGEPSSQQPVVNEGLP